MNKINIFYKVFFILSKILSFLVDPFLWICIIFILGIIIKKVYRRKYFIFLGFILLVFFSNGFIYGLIIKKWNVEFDINNKQYDYGILMGGMISLNSTSENIQFLKNNDRLLNTIELYKNGTIKKILITGASGSMTSEMKEAYILKSFLQNIGIPSKKVLIEEKSKNTYENAIFCQRIINNLHPKNDVNCLAITSDYHMRRTIACFNKTNIKIDPFVKKPSITHFDVEGIIIPQSHILFNWKILFHEIFGYYVYKLMGYT